jgi:hypothetical protein
MPSAGLPRPRDLQKSRDICQATAKVLSISTQQASGDIPLFFWCNELFLRIKSSLFACISCTSLVVLGEGSIQLGLQHGECFLALLSSFSSASARSNVSPYPWSMLHFVEISPRHPATRQQSSLSTQFLWNSTTQGYCHVPSSTAQSGALTPSCGPPSPGRCGHPLEARARHD